MQANRLQALEVARALLASAGPAALGTLDAGGAPFVSHVVSAAGGDGTPILLLSDLAVHTANLRRDPRASLLLVRTGEGESSAAERLTAIGRALPHPDQAGAEALYLGRHPDARGFSRFGDFRYYRLDVELAHVVAGFGVIATLTRAELFGSHAAVGT